MRALAVVAAAAVVASTVSTLAPAQEPREATRENGKESAGVPVFNRNDRHSCDSSDRSNRRRPLFNK